MNMRKIWGYFNNAIMGSGVFLLLLGVEFFAWLRDPKDLIPAWAFYVVQLIMVVLVSVIYACLRYKYDVGRFSTVVPVRYVCRADRYCGWVLIVEDTPILEINRVVTICLRTKDNDIEKMIGLGYVETKNNLGNFQLRVPQEYCTLGLDLVSVGYKALMVKPVVEKDWLS